MRGVFRGRRTGGGKIKVVELERFENHEKALASSATSLFLNLLKNKKIELPITPQRRFEQLFDLCGARCLFFFPRKVDQFDFLKIDLCGRLLQLPLESGCNPQHAFFPGVRLRFVKGVAGSLKGNDMLPARGTALVGGVHRERCCCNGGNEDLVRALLFFHQLLPFRGDRIEEGLHGSSSVVVGVTGSDADGQVKTIGTSAKWFHCLVSFRVVFREQLLVAILKKFKIGAESGLVLELRKLLYSKKNLLPRARLHTTQTAFVL